MVVLLFKVFSNEKLCMIRFNENDSDYFSLSFFCRGSDWWTISEKVKISDARGTMIADKLLFDIKKQTLNIASFKDDKINANINLKWKRVLEF